MIICCGEALVDMVQQSLPATGFLPLLGGSPYNTAVVIGKLGVPVKFMGCISTDFFGEMLIKRCKENRVEEDLVIRTEKNSTLAFVKLLKGKEPQYIFYADGTADSSYSADNLPQKMPDDTKCIVFGSIAMTMEPLASAIEALILREGTRKSVDQIDGAPLISFDPNIRTFMIKDRSAYINRLEKWIAASTIVKFSAGDFNYVYPKLDADRVLQKTIAMGPRLAICTLGAKGAQALLRRNDGSVSRVSVPALNLPVVDTIGAGDAFHGAFLSWLEIKGKMSRSALNNLSETELYNALVFANKTAALVCSRRGAVPPSRREVDSIKLPPPKTAAKAVAKVAANTATKTTAKVAAKPAEKPVAKAAAPAKKAPAKKPAKKK